MLFDQMTRRFYDLLKACHHGREYEPNSPLCENIETILGDYERFEILKEPLPHFAIGINIVRCICAGAQLFTRNGARAGNAFIIKYEMKFGKHIWLCMTESGNKMRLTVEEIHSMFTIGPYLCDVKEIEVKYGQKIDGSGIR